MTWFMAVVTGLLLALALLPPRPDMKWLMLALIAAWPLFGYGIIPARQTQLVAHAPQLAPVMVSLYASAAYIGIALGSILGGQVLDRAGAGALTLVSAGLGGIALILLCAERSRKPRLATAGARAAW